MSHNVLINGQKYVPAPPVAEGSDFETILSFRFNSMDHGEIAVREFLYLLLKTLWDEGEGFSGKRPFGNSGWEYGLLEAAGLAGAYEVNVSDLGDGEIEVEVVDMKVANKYISELIKYVFFGVADA